MRIVLQKVSEAQVFVDDEVIGSIDEGYLILLGVMEGDTEEQADWLAHKAANVRLFDGEDGKINDRSVLDVGGSVLVVSQFTLAGDLKKGNRPDYTSAAEPKEAERLYEYFMESLKKNCVGKIESGTFGAAMRVSLTNEGPVTLVIEK